jgi:threonine dehydratase
MEACTVSILPRSSPDVSIDTVLAARETIAGRLHRTPNFSSATLSELTGAGVHLKAELFQRTGSFKPRGVLNSLAALTSDERARGVITWSAGNHAQAVAYGAAQEGLDCLVVMSAGASPSKVAATRGYGAEVDLQAPDHAAAYDRLLVLIEETGRFFVHPFDDPLVIAGQGTVGLEIAEDVPDVDLVVVPVGGGGLISGIATAIQGLRAGVHVIGVEPEGSQAMSAALAAGKVVQVESSTIADGLGPPFAGELTLSIANERVDEVVLVTEEEIEEGFSFLYRRAKLACEPAGAAATAALLARKVQPEQGETVVAVVSGGNVAPETASAILARR